MQRRWLGLLVTFLSGTLAGCGLEEFVDSQRFSEDFHQSYPMQAGGRLYLETLNGSVEITGWDENTADISAVKSAGSERALRAMRIDVSTSGDSLRIRTAPPSGHWGGMGARYVIRVPRKTQLEKIASSNGRIEVSGVAGPARLETSNGSVRAEGVQGGLEVSTSNGSIRAELAKLEGGEPVRLRTSNGSVEVSVEDLGKSDVVVSTSNASITVRLPSSIAASVRASTSNSSITSQFDVTSRGSFGRDHLEGTIGGGGPQIRLSTSNGGIKLLKF